MTSDEHGAIVASWIGCSDLAIEVDALDDGKQEQLKQPGSLLLLCTDGLVERRNE